MHAIKFKARKRRLYDIGDTWHQQSPEKQPAYNYHPIKKSRVCAEVVGSTERQLSRDRMTYCRLNRIGIRIIVIMRASATTVEGEAASN